MNAIFSSADPATAVLPDQWVRPTISTSRVAYLQKRGIDPTIASIDLEMVKLKLQDVEEGAGWTQEQCESGELEYKRYLTLCKLFPYPEHSIVPNKIMDTVWHYHILDTKNYVADSDRVFGGYFHHYPYFGMRGESDRLNLNSSFDVTCDLYLQTFGESMKDRGEFSDCWHDCESRCWHACKSDEQSS